MKYLGIERPKWFDKETPFKRVSKGRSLGETLAIFFGGFVGLGEDLVAIFSLGIICVNWRFSFLFNEGLNDWFMGGNW